MLAQPPPMFSRRAAVLVAIAALASCHSGCRKSRAPGNGTLALFPADATLVVGVDFPRLRRAPIISKWAGLVLGQNQELAAFTRETGFDPWLQLESIAVAAPSVSGDVAGVVIRAQRLDEARIIAYLRKLNGNRAAEMVGNKRGRHTFWSSPDKPRNALVFLDQRTLIVGVGGWAEAMVDLADGVGGARSADSNADLAKLVNGVSSHTVWIAGLVPQELRTRLTALEPEAPGLSKMRSAAVTADADEDLAVTAMADLAAPADAQRLVALADKHLAALKAAAGADRFKLTADGSVLRGEVRVDATQLAMLAALPFAEALAGGNEPPMRRYAEKLIATSGAKLTVSRCEMFGGSRKGFCIVEGTAADIAAMPVRLHMIKRPPPNVDVRVGQTCAAQEEFGRADGEGHAFKSGVREFAPKGPLPANTDNVKLVSMFAGQTSACIEFEYPYG